MITPTLFVGLGTTGTNILLKLRELMAEEYGHAGLPIFRYIAIETDDGMNVQNADKMKVYESIDLITATIPDIKPVSLKLTQGEPTYNPHLVKWLDPDLLKVAVNGFTAGAANIRMAGRLCLWENWAQVQRIFNNNINAIMAPDTTATTLGILTDLDKIDKNPLDTTGAIKVYVVGSLCGGSCSGMLIDVGYFFRHLLNAFPGKSINGVFTMFDENHAAKPDGMVNVRSANCYASLLELNYYHHKDTTYDITFPDGRRVDTLEKPFDYTLFVSPSGKNPGNQFSTGTGDFDEEGLNLMVALNLFAESAADIDAKKEAIRTNYKANPDFGTPKPVKLGKIPTMVRYMASFGLTAVWYPKYRIASAAACSIGKKLSENWLTSHVPQATTVAAARSEWQKVLRANIEKLTNPDGQPPIKSRIDTHLENAKKQWGNPKISPAQLREYMRGFPSGDPFKKKFEPGGEYLALIEMQEPECKKALHEAIEQTLNNQLGRVDFEGTYGLGDVKMFFEEFDKGIETSIQNCPGPMPTLDLDKLDFSALDRADDNWWLKLIFLQSNASATHRKTVIDDYGDLIVGFYTLIRNYFIKPILQEIRAELGFGVIPMNDGTPNPPLTIKQRLERIEATLKDSVSEFEDGYRKAVNPPVSECVKIVANNPANRIDTDADVLSHQIVQAGEGTTLLAGESMATFLAKDHRSITDQITETYRQLSLAQIQVDDVVTKAQELLDSEGAAFQSFASRSNPYQTFMSTYEPFTVVDLPNIMFGPGGKTLTDLNNDLRGKGFPFGVGVSSVDHLLFFYQEEAGFALDDLVSHDALANRFSQSPGDFGHLTHQDADFYNLELYDKIQKLRDWCRALGKIVPEICYQINQDAFSGTFYPTQNGYVYEYKVDGLSESLSLHDDSVGIRRLAQKGNEIEYNKFFNAVRDCFKYLKREDVTGIVNPMLQEIGDTNQRVKITDFFRQFLDDLYSEDATIDNTDSKSVSSSDFFESPPRMPPQPEPRNRSYASPTPPGPNVGNDETASPSAAKTENSETDPSTAADETEPPLTSETADYEETVAEEVVHESVNFGQFDPERPTQVSQDVSSPEADEDEYTSVGFETQIAPAATEEVPNEVEDTPNERAEPRLEQPPQPDTPDTDEQKVGTDEGKAALLIEQQPQAETNDQTEQKQPSTGFSVKNVDVKQTLQPKGTRQKE